MSLADIVTALEAVVAGHSAVADHVERKHRDDEALLAHLRRKLQLEEDMSQAIENLNAAVASLEAAVTAHKADAIDPAAVDAATARINAAVAVLNAPAAPPAG